MPTSNTFHGSNTRFANGGLHALLAEIIKFRKQLTVRTEFRAQSGWDNALNAYMVEGLEHLGNTLENITYNPASRTKEELGIDAADTTRQLADDYDAQAISSDNVVMPPGRERDVVWQLDGTDVDIPQMTTDNCPNDFARIFITGLDGFFTEATRVDSRFNRNVITKNESVMLRNLLDELYTVCQRKGGEANRTDIVQGTLPSQEPETFQGA